MGESPITDLIRLLAQARRGDNVAWQRLMEPYRAYLTLLARDQVGRRLQGKVGASDLVQETFLDALKALEQFRGATRPELLAWLRQILASRLAKTIRHYYTQARDVRLERDLEEEVRLSSVRFQSAFVDPAQPAADKVDRDEVALRVAAVLEQMPEHYREVLVLRHWQKLPIADVALQMGRTIKSVEKLFVRALTRLGELLGRNPEEL